mmetsp:Transcript_49750/g.124185  ORF Transcript_49750/g.124185 Transcript_49750/m.124185 type:complete len:215 (-) Transcript_49750:652-1296(-)
MLQILRRLVRTISHRRLATLKSDSSLQLLIRFRTAVRMSLTASISPTMFSTLLPNMVARCSDSPISSLILTTSKSSTGLSVFIAAADWLICLILSSTLVASALRASRYRYCTKNFSSFCRNFSTRSPTFHTPKACISLSKASTRPCCLFLSSSLASSPTSCPLVACLSASWRDCLKSSSLSIMTWSKYSILLLSSPTACLCCSESFPASVSSSL